MTNPTDYDRWNSTFKFLAGMLDRSKAIELVKIIGGDSLREMYSMAEVLADIDPDTELSPQKYQTIGTSMLNILLAGECAEENEDIDMEDELINEIWRAYRRLYSSFGG